MTPARFTVVFRYPSDQTHVHRRFDAITRSFAGADGIARMALGPEIIVVGIVERRGPAFSQRHADHARACRAYGSASA